MGFYDYRCHATGLSLRAENAVAVLLLEEQPGKWVPASLPMLGQYNRLGTIDGVVPDFHTTLLNENFRASVESKRLAFKGEAASGWKKPPRDFHDRPLSGLDQVLHVIERATSLGPSDVKLSGRPLNHTLLHAGFFKAALEALGSPEPDVSTGALLERAFPSEAARWFLRDLPELTAVRPQVRAALHAFHAWRTFIEPRVPWAPSRDMGQHGDLETLEGFATARARFSDVPWAMTALDEALATAERAERDQPSGWLRNAERSWYGVVIDDERFVASSPEQLREVLQDALDHTDPSLAKVRELIVVQEGRIAQTTDLSPVLHAKVGDRLARLSEPAAAELALADDVVVVFQWDEVAQLLPPQTGTPLPAGAPAMLRVPEPAPKWLRAQERYARVLHFDA